MTNIEVVESRSDDDTTCCSSSCCNGNYGSSLPVHASRSDSSDDDVRDDCGDGSCDERTDHDFMDDNDQQYFDAHDDSPSAIAVGTIMPQIPEEVTNGGGLEVGSTPSSEESELSAGSKETETTIDVSYGSTTGSVGSGSEAVHVSNDAEPAICIVSSAEANEDLTAVPSDDAVIATSTDEDEEDTDGAKTVEAPNNVDANPGQEPQAQANDLALARQQWEDAMLILMNNPALMTAEILNLSLAHRAPLHVVSAMLRINPDSAGVPSSGPSALQVAIKQRSSIDVIERIIRACPYALFDSCGQAYDPLSLAKIYRREEKDLVDLLSLPISHWISDDSQNASKSKKTVRFESTNTPPNASASDSRPPPPPPPPAPILKSASQVTKEEKRELSNMKLIVAAIVKSQKKLMKENEVNSQEVKILAKSEARSRREIAEFVEERMKKIAKSHLIAMDMSERAFESRVDSFGNKMAGMLDEVAVRQERTNKEQAERDEKLQKTIEDAISTIAAAADKVERASASCDTKLADLSVKIDAEVNSLKMRQNQLEEKVDKTSSSAGCDADVFEEPSFEIESISETTSTDHLFSDDVECGFDETLVSGLYQIESSFSSEWNASTQRLVVDEPVHHSSTSWWQAAGSSGNSHTRRRRRWRCWFKKLS